jgi:hypothetical protein
MESSFFCLQKIRKTLRSNSDRKAAAYTTFWEGPSYKVSVYDRTSVYERTSDQYTPEIAFNIKKANLNMYFQQQEWESLQKLLNQALTQRDIPLRVDALKLQYGSSF